MFDYKIHYRPREESEFPYVLMGKGSEQILALTSKIENAIAVVYARQVEKLKTGALEEDELFFTRRERMENYGKFHTTAYRVYARIDINRGSRYDKYMLIADDNGKPVIYPR